jgi:hypothetical protein
MLTRFLPATSPVTSTKILVLAVTGPELAKNGPSAGEAGKVIEDSDHELEGTE